MSATTLATVTRSDLETFFHDEAATVDEWPSRRERPRTVRARDQPAPTLVG